MTRSFPISSSAVESAFRNRTRARRRDQRTKPAQTNSITGVPTDLARLLEAHVAASPHVLSAGPDPVCQELWRAACFHDERLVAMSVKLAAKLVTLVAVPDHLWLDSGRRTRVFALKRAAVRSGRRVMVLSEGALRREPRLGNAILMAQAAHALIGAEDRISVMAALAEEPGMALGDVIQVVRHEPDRVAAVLSLARSGIIEIDLRKPIGPLSPLWLRTIQV